MSAEGEMDLGSEVAVIGYSGRFPGAGDGGKYWDNLRGGVESIRSFTVAELASVGVSAGALRDADYVRVGAPLADLDGFDAGFFGISPREASIMDPQQRFFMEGAWAALEQAGYAPGTFAGSTGVFAGSGPNSYLIHNLLSDPELVARDGIFLLRHTGNDKDVLATRVSYQMNLHGPSLNVQTACSTSLVAVHLACQSLLHLDCDLALAGAVSLEVPHAIGYQYRQNEIQSHDGHCRSFDANATGTVFGSGVGIVVLKRLADALEAGDTIHAVIKGTAVNNDGSRKVGFLAPSAEGQVEVIREALGAAGVEPATIDYIETHGTGTPIGDPIELSALEQVFGKRHRPLRIGAVKTNIGHCDTAAGMAGLLKTVLALKHRQIPATLHFKTLNPLIDAATTKLQVVDRLTEWRREGTTPRRAGVTSLGIGGTNAHVILEEAPEFSPSAPGRPVKLFTFSAKTAEALDEGTRAWAQHLAQHPEENLDDAAYTLHVGRKDFTRRRMIVARDRAEARQRAEAGEGAGVVTGQAVEKRPVAFLFSGQGAQYVHAGAELYRSEPIFRKWLDRCADWAQPQLGFDFRTLLYPAPEKAQEAAEQIKLTWHAQPILFSIEYALAQLWLGWGIKPAKLIGHSLGEIAAAAVAGVFTLEDAVGLVCARGQLLKQVREGAMLAVSIAEADLTPWLTDELSLAAVNGPEQCVVSGPTEAIVGLKDKLAGQRIAAQRLETSHAFHSRALDPVLEDFVKRVAQKKLRAPRIPLVSNVTGAWLTDAEATDPSYWGRHFRGTVRFHDGLKLIQAEGESCLLEIGPGETLASLARQAGAKEGRGRIFPSLPRAGAKEASAGDLATVLYALGGLWVHGVAVDWKAFHAGEKRKRVPLPTYAFQRKKHWLGPKIGTNWLGETLGSVEDWFHRASWKSAPLPAGKGSAGPWLVFADEASAKVADELRAQNATVICVRAGEKFAVLDNDAYAINPAEPGDYAQLLERLIQRKQVPRQIAYLWGMNAGDRAEDRCFHDLLYLLQSLGAKTPDQAVALTAVAQRSVSVHREPVLHPYGSLLGGPCRVAPLEYPTLRCRQIDVDGAEPAALASLLLAEGESDSAVSLAAYRAGVRWVEGVERFHPEPAADRLREKGTYLITGGLGGLGLAIADWLARTYHARLVLLSRSGRPDAAQQRQMEEWRALGAEVLVVAGDVTSRDSLRPALAQARAKFGPLHGIIHAAGLLQDGIIQLKKRSTAHRVLAPKIDGVQILDELTRDEPLEFFALFSSVSAITPPDGQVDYCAANAFLNAFAQSQPTGRKFVVIGWGPWAQVGMVAPKTELAPNNAAPFHHPLLERVELDTAARTIYSGTLSVERHWVLGEHHFHGGDSLLPGTAHLEIAVTALWKKIGQQPITLENIVFLAPLRVAPHRPCIVHAELRKAGAGYQFSVTADDVVYVSGQGRAAPGRAPKIDLAEIAARCPEVKTDGPKNVRQRGHFDFGPRWHSLRQIAFGQNEGLGLVELLPEYRAEAQTYALHPALMDIATGVAMYLIPGYDQPGDLLLPFAYNKMTVYGPLPPRVHSHTRLKHDAGSDLISFDLTLANDTGQVIAQITEFTVKRLRSVNEVAQVTGISIPTATTPLHIVAEPNHGIPTLQGIAALQRVLKSRTPDVIYVSPVAVKPLAPLRDTGALVDSVTAQVDDVNLVLEQIWQRLLGLDHVDARTDFFDSGGHSLLAVRLFTEIRKRFNIDFGLSTLFEARTVGALSDLIRKAREADPSSVRPVVGNTMVAIRSSGAKNAPLFLIHDVGGAVLRYEHLARHFPDDQAIYAIESRGLSGLRADYTVEAMAGHYLKQIRERQPHGPYYVAGHSFGGLVTYELARQLRAQGEKMGLVGLLDTFQRNSREDEDGPQAMPVTGKLPIFQRLFTDARAVLLGRDRIGYLQERRTYIQAWAVKTTYRTAFRLSRRLGWPMPWFLNDVKEANWIALDNFTPKPFDGRVVLFRCKDRLDTDPPDSSHVWRRLARDGVAILETPGDHNSMLREPGVRILAGQMMSYLRPAKVATVDTQSA